VATDFNKDSGGGTHEYSAASGGSSEPTEMDFFFGVEMTMLRELIPVQLWFGQSSSGDTVSWWIGGDLIINLREPLLLVITEDYHHVKILALSGTNDSFTMVPVAS